MVTHTSPASMRQPEWTQCECTVHVCNLHDIVSENHLASAVISTLNAPSRYCWQMWVCGLFRLYAQGRSRTEGFHLRRCAHSFLYIPCLTLFCRLQIVHSGFQHPLFTPSPRPSPKCDLNLHKFNIGTVFCPITYHRQTPEYSYWIFL